ncbi:DNA-binding transcriptional regulator, ArsR family [Chitinophaga sp. YR573]|uniref:ArsR/SmtB family transcription factor n=1 Tax=Chitinophaga sp. YR573 TaxID=1881040 RepID=UPI0008CF6B9F|nr:helix-turn-helix transcriptional regulator [Chitinophaga sp. YR573]SEW07228.1 DNA-binding transcriptional regulator, ArsR family [Chitinophaga sp. YR573]
MESRFKEIAALIGDPTRATIMWVLLDGKAFTATELAIAADTSPQNISMHLNKLVQAELLCVESQGRHKYYKFSSKDIAYAIEGLANIIPPVTTKKNPDSPVTYCRTCYDHLAGKVGVMITDSLIQQKIIVDFEVSKKGEKWFAEQGLDINELKQQRRSFLRSCLDWSERRPHIAGSLATALLDKMLEEDWVRRTKNSRAIVITSKGQKNLYHHFKLTV